MAKKLSELIPQAFHSTWRAALNSSILNIIEKGGRGSGKSSDIAHIITQLLMRYAVNAVGIRYVDNTLEQSIYEQMKWAIEEQGVTYLFKFNKVRFLRSPICRVCSISKVLYCFIKLNKMIFILAYCIRRISSATVSL